MFVLLVWPKGGLLHTSFLNTSLLLIRYKSNFSTAFYSSAIFVYVIGLHAVQFGNNWMRKIPRTAKLDEAVGRVQFGSQRNFSNSVISSLRKQTPLVARLILPPLERREMCATPELRNRLWFRSRDGGRIKRAMRGVCFLRLPAIGNLEDSHGVKKMLISFQKANLRLWHAI